jgi:pimeloyl-ACP methyl ester carboxylesterase
MITSIATTTPTQFLDVGRTRFAYRHFGTPAGTPLVFTQHFMGNLDNFDPAIANALAPGREIILFDNAGVGRSTGIAPAHHRGHGGRRRQLHRRPRPDDRRHPRPLDGRRDRPADRPVPPGPGTQARPRGHRSPRR